MNNSITKIALDEFNKNIEQPYRAINNEDIAAIRRFEALMEGGKKNVPERIPLISPEMTEIFREAIQDNIFNSHENVENGNEKNNTEREEQPRDKRKKSNDAEKNDLISEYPTENQKTAAVTAQNSPRSLNKESDVSEKSKETVQNSNLLYYSENVENTFAEKNLQDQRDDAEREEQLRDKRKKNNNEEKNEFISEYAIENQVIAPPVLNSQIYLIKEEEKQKRILDEIALNMRRNIAGPSNQAVVGSTIAAMSAPPEEKEIIQNLSREQEKNLAPQKEKYTFPVTSQMITEKGQQSTQAISEKKDILNILRENSLRESPQSIQNSSNSMEISERLPASTIKQMIAQAEAGQQLSTAGITEGSIFNNLRENGVAGLSQSTQIALNMLARDEQGNKENEAGLKTVVARVRSIENFLEENEVIKLSTTGTNSIVLHLQDGEGNLQKTTVEVIRSQFGNGISIIFQTPHLLSYRLLSSNFPSLCSALAKQESSRPLKIQVRLTAEGVNEQSDAEQYEEYIINETNR